MICDACQRDGYECAIAITPICISSAVAAISFLQYRVSKNKLRLDLYNRRFAIYEKSLAAYQAHYNSEKIDEGCMKSFIQACRESIFLFGKESAVHRTMEGLREALTSPPSPSVNPAKFMEALEVALEPWLDFKKIEK